MASAPTLHGGLQSVDRVDLCDDDASAEPTQSLDAAFTHVTIACHHSNFTGNHHISSPLDAVYQALPAAVQVVKLTLQRDRKYITTCSLGPACQTSHRNRFTVVFNTLFINEWIH